MSPEKLLFIGSQTLVLRTMRLENVRRFPSRQSKEQDEILDTKEIHTTNSKLVSSDSQTYAIPKMLIHAEKEKQLKFQWYLGTKFDFES